METRRFSIPPFYYFWILFALTLSLGAIWHREIAGSLLLSFPLLLLGAALPTLGVMAHGALRLGSPLKWQHIALALFIGSTVSIIAALILEFILPFLAYLLIAPLRPMLLDFGEIGFGTPGFIERLFFTPYLVLFLIFTAIQAPIPEEFAKDLGPLFLSRKIKNERQALLLGLCAGAGFAILENLLYESVYAQWNGWSWGGITLLRGFGSILHPLCTGIISLALYRARGSRKSWLASVGPAYLLSVGLHTLWNGGFEPLVYLTGMNSYLEHGPTVSFYGLAVPTLLIVYLVVLSAALWGYFIRLTHQLGHGEELELVPALVSRRRLAGAAFALVAVFVPMGAMLGPAWPGIRAAAVGGLPPTHTPTPTPIPTVTPFPSDTPNPSANLSVTFIPAPTTANSDSLPAEATATQLPVVTSVRAKDDMTMVFVLAGQFSMGSDKSYSNEKPVHTPNLDAFWIDETEVTNGRYAKCVQSGTCLVPKNFSSYSHASYYANTVFDNFPVINVTWNQAKTYCEWVGGRLPTEAEWEKAARGLKKPTYPWGEKITRLNANFNQNYVDVIQVASLEGGRSPYGAYDMAGNVSEWVADWYSGSYYDKSPADNPSGPLSGTQRVIRGGSWADTANSERSSARDPLSPDTYNNNLGFRCASSTAP